MKKTILRACYAVLLFTLTVHAAAQRETINVPGGGTLSYTYNVTTSTCENKGNQLVSFDTVVYSNFSFTDSGTTTGLSGSTVVIFVLGLGGGSCPTASESPVTLTASNLQIVFQPYAAPIGSGAADVPVYSGYVNPKYLIMGVTYAPPGGVLSYASYAAINFVGNTSKNSSSFSQNYTESVSLSGGSCDSQVTQDGLAGFQGGVCVTGSQSNAWTLTSNSSNTITTSKQTALTVMTPGVPNVYSPVDHDYDIIWLWLNPVVTFSVPGTNTSSAGTITWTGYGYDYNDPLHEIDVWPIYVGYLNGDFGPLDPQDANALARTWVTTQTFAPGQGPGITSADYPNILGADPFAKNPGYLVTLASGTNPLTTTDGRFTQAGVNGVAPQTIPYKQAGPNSTTGLNELYQDTYVQTSELGQGGSYTYTMGFGLEEKFGDGFFGLGVIYDFKQNWNFTWEDTWQNTVTNTTTTVDTLSITGPPCPAPVAPCVPLYTEPHEFAVYEDNLYGTFMFWPNPYFSIGPVTPAAPTVVQGKSTSLALPSAANAGYAGTLSGFSVTGLPSGATSVLSPGSGAAGTAFNLAVNTTASTPVGTYPLTISATDGSLLYFTYATLAVTAAPTFSLSATPSSQTAIAGTPTTYTVSTSTTTGFTGVVSLSVSGLPSGATSVFNPASISGVGSSTLTVTTSTSTAPGNYTLTITGASSNPTQTAIATVTLVVAVPTFSISVAPGTQTVTAGSSTTYTVSAKAINGFSGSVTLSTGTLPSGVSATFSPNTIAAGSSSTMTVNTTSATAAGSYSLTVNGTSGSLTNTAIPSPILIVNPVPSDFSVAATPSSRTVTVGASTNYTFSTTAINGFTGVVSLSASGLPTGATAAFSPTSITGSGSSTLTVTTASSTPAGTYTLTLTGVSGSLTHSATVTLVVQAASFSIAVSPSSVTTAVGSSATYTVTTTAINGFNGVVTLSVVTPPSNSSASFSPATITGSGSSTLTIATSGNTLPGTYAFTIKATSGSLTVTKTATLIVTGTNFTLSASPGTETVTAGGSTTYTVKAAGVSGFTGTITLSLPGLPAGASATFSPISIAGSGNSTLTISTTSSTAAGEYFLFATGTSGTLIETTEIILHVNN